MKIRPATLEDWTDLAILIEAMNVEERVEFGMPDFTRLHLDTVHLIIASGLGGVFVAEDDNEIVAFSAWVSFPTFPVGYVEGIGAYTTPSLRRSKVAHELGVAAMNHFAAQGGEYVYGRVYFANEPSMARCFAEGAEKIGYLIRRKIEPMTPKEG